MTVHSSLLSPNITSVLSRLILFLQGLKYLSVSYHVSWDFPHKRQLFQTLVSLCCDLLITSPLRACTLFCSGSPGIGDTILGTFSNSKTQMQNWAVYLSPKFLKYPWCFVLEFQFKWITTSKNWKFCFHIFKSLIALEEALKLPVLLQEKFHYPIFYQEWKCFCEARLTPFHWLCLFLCSLSFYDLVYFILPISHQTAYLVNSFIKHWLCDWFMPSFKAFFMLTDLTRYPQVRGHALEHNFIVWREAKIITFSKQFSFLLHEKFWKSLTFHSQMDFFQNDSLKQKKKSTLWSRIEIIDTQILTFSKTLINTMV